MRNSCVIPKAITGFVLLVGGIANLQAADIQQTTESPSLDNEQYQHLMSYKLRDNYGLETFFNDHQNSLLQITPPDPELILRQPGVPNIIPFSPLSRDDLFFKGLVGVYENSVPVYPVTVLEDPKTREVVFLNADGQKIQTLPAAPGYDPYTFLNHKWPDLFTGRYTSDYVAYLKSLYDPARIQLTIKLISTDDLEYYLYAQAKIDAYAALLAPASLGGGMMMLMGGTNDEFVICSQVLTNGMEIGVQVPMTNAFDVDLFVFDADMYRTFNGLVPVWDIVATNLPTTSNLVFWTDTAYAEAQNRFYAAGNADLDTDGDGVPDDREVLTYKSNTNSVDSDGDGMGDGNEVAMGFPPAFSNGAAQVSIRSPLNGTVIP